MPNALCDDYRAMLRIRRFERRVEQLVSEQRMTGTVHLCMGQEAVAVGVCGHLRQTDLAVSTHRGHGHLLAKGGDCGRLMAELAGRLAGYCRGKGGTQHVSAVDVGFMGSNGITGGGIPIAVGLGLAKRNQGTDDVVVSFLGDGAVTTGAFHESLNLAALWNVRVMFVCENNGYAMSNPVAEAVSTQSIPEWASRYGNMPTKTVDGNDVCAVREATEELVG
ncbi:MAG: thiamine pyrophosphate-dependent dehydrogenase E1 component subunit alpha, partial [Pirellulaceae bacterium]|nr:thiamine pyrophosphate-dependent dehydrogenase E1 component subunit alpha [Pirellulaceae bacterium]